VGSLQDIEMLNEAGIPSVIVGKAIYEDHISLKELSRYLS
jgi:phosphoribosylformimino-5-aminoimidazole carboxamide ribotide isomerase